MTWEGLLDPRSASQLLAVLLMFALAGWLLRIDFNARVNRAFALFLLFRGMTMGLAALASVAPDPVASDYWTRLTGYFYVAALPTLLYFVCVYPKRITWIGRSRAGLASVFLGGLGLEAWYLLNHCAWSCASARPGLTALGPLAAIPIYFAVAVAGLAFAIEHVRAPEGPRKASLLLVGGVFLVNAIFDGVRGLADLFGGGWSEPTALGLEPSTWAYLNLLGPPIALVPAALGIALLTRAKSPGGPRGRVRWKVLAATGLAVGSGAIVGMLTSGNLASFGGLFVVGLWRLAIPLFVTYAIVRHQLFDVDVRVKGTLRRSWIVGAFLLVYFVASEMTEGLVEARWGPVGGLVAAAGLTLATARLERAGARFANLLMPGVDAAPDHAGARKVEMYRAAVESVMEDGVVTDRERVILDRLRSRLDLPLETASKVEEEVRRTVPAATA